MILDIQGLTNYNKLLVQVMELLNGGGVGDVSFNQTVTKFDCEYSHAWTVYIVLWQCLSSQLL